MGADGAGGGREPGCVFCSIVAGEAEASFVAREDRVCAFMDIRPVTDGHLLIVPDSHVESLADMDAEDAAQMFALGIRLATAARATVPCDGVNLFLADGEAAGQEVDHVHLHVIPRTPGDGFLVDAEAWSRPAPTREHLDAIAARIHEGTEQG